MTHKAQGLIDGHGRRIDYLRLSVLEQCQMRCIYCHPGRHRGVAQPRLPAPTLVRLAAAFASLGVTRVRLTGGEPLLRNDLAAIAEGVSALPGVREVTLSTNAERLSESAHELRAAGVRRVNISLDTLDPETFTRITGNGDLGRVLAGIDAALECGLRPVKLNMVVMRGINDHEIGPMVDFAMARGLDLRFIETMPIGPAGTSSTRHLVRAESILTAVRRHCASDLVPVMGRGGGPARHYRVGTGTMTVGVIAAMSRHFCTACNRVRLTAGGDLQLCLGRPGRVALGRLIEAGASDDELCRAIRDAIRAKPRTHGFADPAVSARLEMTALGG